MMKLILGYMSLVLLPWAAGQNGDACSFCNNNNGQSFLSDPDRVVISTSVSNKTCADLAREASDPYLTAVYGCNYFAYYAYLCGCYNDEEEEEAPRNCQLCQEGETVASEMRNIVVDGQRCQELEQEAKFNPFYEDCSYYYYRGSLCGCNNVPPSDGCSLCVAHGSEPSLSDKQAFSEDNDFGTCAHMSDYTKYVVPDGTPECVARQAVYGEYCGCEKDDDEEKEAPQPSKACPICEEEGMAVSNDIAPTYSYLSSNGQTTIHHSGKTCLEAEVEANELVLSSTSSLDGDGEQICTSMRDQLAEACCKVVNVANNETEPVQSAEAEEEPEEETAATAKEEEEEVDNVTDIDTVFTAGVIQDDSSAYTTIGYGFIVGFAVFVSIFTE